METVLNLSGSISIPLHFQFFGFFFLNEHLGNNCCVLNTIINHTLPFLPENHYESQPSLPEGKEQSNPPNHRKWPQIPIYLKTSEENLHSQEYFLPKALKNPYALSVGLPENRTYQQPDYSLRQILEGISHYRHIPVNKTDYCTASPSKAREPGLLRLRMWFKPWEGIWKMPLLTAERRERRWRMLIFKSQKEQTVEV